MEQPEQRPRITLREIGRRLNVSHATVSRALRNDPRITVALRREIQDLADKMGYLPDPMLAALSNYRWSKGAKPIGGELAWINCWPEPARLRTYNEFNLYWQGATEEAKRAGFRLEEFCCPQELSPERLKTVLLARNIRGLLLTPRWSRTAPDWGGLDWNEFHVVRFGYSLETPQAHLVTSNQLMDGMLAYENIWNLGYRRIGMAMRTAQGTRLVRFSAGYLYAQLRRDSTARLRPLVLGEPNPKEDLRLLSLWLKETKPDAILTDVSTIKDLLVEAGCRVPEDIGLAALSVLDGHADAGINQNSKEIGRAAVQTLISLIHHNERGIPAIPREVLVAGNWVDGSTLPNKAVAK